MFGNTGVALNNSYRIKNEKFVQANANVRGVNH
jgi:hypothetical protein